MFYAGEGPKVTLPEGWRFFDPNKNGFDEEDTVFNEFNIPVYKTSGQYIQMRDFNNFLEKLKFLHEGGNVYFFYDGWCERTETKYVGGKCVEYKKEYDVVHGEVAARFTYYLGYDEQDSYGIVKSVECYFHNSQVWSTREYDPDCSIRKYNPVLKRLP